MKGAELSHRDMPILSGSIFRTVLLFLLSAMTFINTMSERNIFEAMRARLVSWGLSLRPVV
jgi:Na+/H+ antiporter NhaD/arsenite permease-like protein